MILGTNSIGAAWAAASTLPPINDGDDDCDSGF
jgi:hypothetical protein